MMNYTTNYKLVFDETQLQKFWNVLSRYGLKEDEAYFTSLSARKKYLAPSEREYYNLNRAEMFGRKLVRENTFEAYLKVVRSLESSLAGYTTKNGKPMPYQALVVYAQLNPVSGIQALKEFYQKTQKELFDGYNIEGHSSGVLKKLDTVLLNCYQHSRGSYSLIDIDFDTQNISYVEKFIDVLRLHEVKYWILNTRSGYHVMIDKYSVNFNYVLEVVKADARLKDAGEPGEIVVNRNQMVPTPGTMQGGHKVELL